MSEEIRVTLTQKSGFRFEVDFGQPPVPAFQVDEYPPLGDAAGPNPTRVLAAAVGHCLSASLLFCLRKARIEPSAMGAVADVSMVRNDQGRLRIGEIKVTLAPTLSDEDRQRIGRCLELFEDFCVVTESVRHGIPVEVHVVPATPP